MNRAIEIIKTHLEYLKTELEPTYCGQHDYQVWQAEHDAQVRILEEVLDEIEQEIAKDVNKTSK